ncbi:MAG: c-type cytochrome [Terracidiphilus sp.]
MRILIRQFSLILFVGLLSGCTGGKALSSYQVATGGNAARGEQVIVQYRCGSCHTIPGIHNANGVFGPPLNKLARRSILAGDFPNEPDILVHWVESPTTMKPATAMPDLGLSEQQARDAAAYLETLR